MEQFSQQIAVTQPEPLDAMDIASAWAVFINRSAGREDRDAAFDDIARLFSEHVLDLPGGDPADPQTYKSMQWWQLFAIYRAFGTDVDPEV
jgi:hypothetical protein